MILLWATRGRDWGFRFLIRGDFADPLPEYDRVFAGHNGRPEVYVGIADKVGLRFADPEDRRDRSGRVISHDFVLEGALGDRVTSVKAGIEIVWPRVAARYASVWSSETTPSPFA